MTFLFGLGDTQMGAVLWRASRSCSYCNAVCLCLRFAVRRQSPSYASADACRSSDRRADMLAVSDLPGGDFSDSPGRWAGRIVINPSSIVHFLASSHEPKWDNAGPTGRRSGPRSAHTLKAAV